MVGGFRRFLAFYLDIFVVSLMMMPLMLLPPFRVLSEAAGFERMAQIFYPVMGIAVMYVLLKDVFGRSLGKVVMGLTIKADDGSDSVPIAKRILRNVTTPI